jgi:hypothetical protein
MRAGPGQAQYSWLMNDDTYPWLGGVLTEWVTAPHVARRTRRAELRNI